MILDYYGIREQPFGATPDARYLFESGTHREALGSILYGLEAGRGFIGLIAKPGMGKTTLLFRSLVELREKGRTVFLFQTISTPLDFLRTLLADLGVADLQGSFFELQAKLNEILLEQARRGERLVVVIDETQNLDDSVLELIRMLSNFETPQEKLMQIILSGQPQLARKLASPSLMQLRQRISIIAHLCPFSADDTVQYVDHRLRTAGYTSDRALFTPAALRLIAQHSEGIPRNINNLCFNALSLGCALKRSTIDVDTIREVIADLDLDALMELPAAVSEPLNKRIRQTDTRKRPASWLLIAKAVLASTVMFATTGVAVQKGHNMAVLASVIPAQKRTQAPSGTTQAPPHSLVSATRSAPLSCKETGPRCSGNSQPKAAQLDRENDILVPPGVTLYQICNETMNSCNSKKLNQIRRLNPWLKNPNHLESGRQLRIPSPERPDGSTSSPAQAAPAVIGIRNDGGTRE